MTNTSYLYDGSSNLIIDDQDGGLDRLTFDITYNTWFPTADKSHFVKDVTWQNGDLTIETETGNSVTLVNQNGANGVEEMILSTTSPFLYTYNQGLNGSNQDDWIAMENAGTAKGKNGNDLIFGSAGNDDIRGGNGVDILLGLGGNDTIRGGNDRNSMDGGDGDDRILGGSAEDWMHGGNDNDVLKGFGGRDQLYGDAGDDRLFGGDDDDILYGGSGKDTLKGGEGNDSIGGGEGNDTLRGEGGHDWLIGNDGKDKMFGGTGADTFGFDATSFNDVDQIKDLNLAEGDRIDLSNILDGFYDSLNDAIADFVQITDNGTHSFIKVDQNGGADNFQTVGRIDNVTGLDATTLETNGDLLA